MFMGSCTSQSASEQDRKSASQPVSEEEQPERQHIDLFPRVSY